MWIHWVENRVAIIRRATDDAITQACVCVCPYQLQHTTTNDGPPLPTKRHTHVCVSPFPYALSLTLTARTHWPKNRVRSEKSNGKNHIRNEMRLWCSVCMGKNWRIYGVHTRVARHNTRQQRQRQWQQQIFPHLHTYTFSLPTISCFFFVFFFSFSVLRVSFALLFGGRVSCVRLKMCASFCRCKTFQSNSDLP